MLRRALMVATGLLLAGSAHAAVTFEILGEGSATDVSADGSVIVGQLGSRETFRWTRETGVVPLGACATCVLGRIAGNPMVSSDGTVVAASILTPDSTALTPGIWHLGSGWQALMPPVPADGGVVDQSYGSSWTLSDDGTAVGGLYWRPGATNGTAHAFRWTQAGGLVDLGSAGSDSRANGSNHDGSVMAGWVADSIDGHWRATVWSNGTKTILTTSAGVTQCEMVSLDGSVVGGSDYDDATHLGVAALWKWNGSTWTRTLIGSLPGTFPFYGGASALGMSANGLTVVGSNRYDSFGTRTGFIWTQATGMIEINQFLADNDVTVPADFQIALLRGISANGRVMVGFGQDVFSPYTARWFRIELSDPVGVEPHPVALSLRATPNPVRSNGTAISFSLPSAGSANVALFDVTGRRVRTLVDGERAAGVHQVRWDARDDQGAPVAAGLYYVRLQADRRTRTQRIAVVR